MVDDYSDNKRPECARNGDQFCKESCKYSATCSAVVKAGYCWAHRECATCEYTKDCAAFHHRGENWEDFGRIDQDEAENGSDSELAGLKSILESLTSAKVLLDNNKELTWSGNYVAMLNVREAQDKVGQLMHDIETRRKAPVGRKLNLSDHRFTLALMSILEDAYGHLKGNVFGSAKKARALVREALGNIRNLSAYSIRDDKNGLIFLAPERIGKKRLEEILSGTEKKSLEERVRELERLTCMLKKKLEEAE